MVWLAAGFVALVCVGALFLYLRTWRKTYSIKGKHVLITGGSSGIGKALAAEAIHRGATTITLLARNQERLQSAKAELEWLIPRGSTQKVHTISADVSSVAVEAALHQSLSSTGPVDVLVNCAGITHTAPFVDTPPEKFQDILQVNVLGSVYLTRALLPSMIERKEGRIVFISSQAGQLGLYGYTAYSASKYALRGLAETLQMEVYPYNIRVSISFPPDTDTPQLREEQGQRSVLVKELASYGTVFQADHVARTVWGGVERERFQVTHGFDGFMLGTVTSGVSPVTHSWDALVQVMLMGVFRVVTLVYLTIFYRVVQRALTKDQKKKSQ